MRYRLAASTKALTQDNESGQLWGQLMAGMGRKLTQAFRQADALVVALVSSARPALPADIAVIRWIFRNHETLGRIVRALFVEMPEHLPFPAVEPTAMGHQHHL